MAQKSHERSDPKHESRLTTMWEQLTRASTFECPVCLEQQLQTPQARLLRCCANAICNDCLPLCKETCPFCRTPFVCHQGTVDGANPYVYSTLDYRPTIDYRASAESGAHDWSASYHAAAATIERYSTDALSGRYVALADRYNASLTDGDYAASADRYNASLTDGDYAASADRYNASLTDGDYAASADLYCADSTSGDYAASADHYCASATMSDSSSFPSGGAMVAACYSTTACDYSAITNRYSSADEAL